jgi:hypothetical protein
MADNDLLQKVYRNNSLSLLAVYEFLKIYMEVDSNTELLSSDKFCTFQFTKTTNIISDKNQLFIFCTELFTLSLECTLGCLRGGCLEVHRLTF